MYYDREREILNISAQELSSYAYKRKSAPSAGGFSEVGRESAGIEIGEYVQKSFLIESDVGKIRLSGTIDRIYEDGDSICAEMLCDCGRLPRRFSVSRNAELLARAAVCANIFCRCESCRGLIVRLTFYLRDRSEDTISFERYYDSQLLERMTESLICRAQLDMKMCRERATVRIDELSALAFPYGRVRDGQSELMISAMRTFRRGGRLLASAPTGTGKTMAMLYPALKALSGGYADRIFYLTGKGVTGKAALDAATLISEQAPHLRCIMLRAKERLCRNTDLLGSCMCCPRMSDTSDGLIVRTYKERELAALSELLNDKSIYDAADIFEIADRHGVCPHELSLDLSEYSDIIICDYNYLFDSGSRLARYFSRDRGERYLFLTDEAHNLPDRVRRMYSARIATCDIKALLDSLGEEAAYMPDLSSAIERIDRAFENIADECASEAKVITDRDGEHTVGFTKRAEVPYELVSACGELLRTIRRTDISDDAISTLSDKLSSFISASSEIDDGTIFFAQSVDCDLECKIICIDPSSIISRQLDMAHASVLFSATLDPDEYFSDMLGSVGVPFVHAESPFDKDNLSVTVFDGISTRLSDRRDTVEDVARVISTVLDARSGNYLVFSPSYEYMRTVCRAVLKLRPDICAVMQKPDMSLKARSRFLEIFSEKRAQCTVGFCVLGGIFSEGIDLAGDGLIGVIVVGAGLPGISTELNLMCEYYENRFGNGHLFAYEYPALNRIEQAAGRVIRSADDRGVVVLIDDRMSAPETLRKFPKFWPAASCTSDISTLSVILKRFWKKTDG